MNEKIVEIMAAGAYHSVKWSSFWSTSDAKELMRAAVTALEQAGYAIVPVSSTAPAPA